LLLLLWPTARTPSPIPPAAASRGEAEAIEGEFRREE